jgi:hypothetical protein
VIAAPNFPLRRSAARLPSLAFGLTLAVRSAGSAVAPRARVGPKMLSAERVFVEALRKDLRVPLRAEGPTRTMRGREDVDSASALLSWFSRGAGVGSGLGPA